MSIDPQVRITYKEGQRLSGEEVEKLRGILSAIRYNYDKGRMYCARMENFFASHPTPDETMKNLRASSLGGMLDYLNRTKANNFDIFSQAHKRQIGDVLDLTNPFFSLKKMREEVDEECSEDIKRMEELFGGLENKI